MPQRYIMLLICAFMHFLQAMDIKEPLDISLKDSEILILEVIYPKKCEIKDRDFLS